MNCKLRCFSYMHTFDSELCREALSTINSLHYYFYKYNKNNVELAKQKALYHVLVHYNTNGGELEPYIKKLARTIELSSKPKKEVSGELIDFTISESSEDVSCNVLSTMDDFIDKVHRLAIEYYHYFMLWGYHMFELKEKTDSLYFPPEFKIICMTLSRQNESFLSYCNMVYKTYGQAMRSYEKYDLEPKNWKEADYTSLKSLVSRRITFVDKFRRPLKQYNGMCLELDNLDCFIWGKLGDKRVVRIKYTDVWDLMCNLIDSQEDNEMRLNIGNYYSLRTLGGSSLLVNTDLQTAYNLCLDEIESNLLHFTFGRCMGRGLDYLYFLVNDIRPLPDCSAMGLSFKFELEDVTDRFKPL